MMEVKGGVLKPIIDFIKTRHGEEAYQKWLSSLSPDAQKIYSGQILPSLWYPFELGHLEAAKKIADLFYPGNIEGMRELGYHMAENNLNGIYKVFVKMGSPGFIISKAGIILSTYYRPGKLETIEQDDKLFRFRLVNFERMEEALEVGIAGWVEKALQLSGGKNVKVKINSYISKGDPATEYECHWDK